jgi:hypothetical protein
MRILEPSKRLITISGMILISCSPSFAGPPLYVDSFTVSATQQECLAKMKKVLLASGFAEANIRPTTSTTPQGKSVHDGWDAEHPEMDISVAIECESRKGRGAFGVSGSNNKHVYGIYERVFDLIRE